MDRYRHSDEGTRRLREFGEELLDVITPLRRAIAVMERKKHGGASMVQLKRAGGVIKAL